MKKTETPKEEMTWKCNMNYQR